MSWYGTQIKKPQWQKKRLEILSRDEWKCTMCDDKEEELHIHHKSYKGKPWEVDNSELQSVCKKCHLILEEYGKEVDFEKAINLNGCADIKAFNTDSWTYLFSFDYDGKPYCKASFIRGGKVLQQLTDFNKI